MIKIPGPGETVELFIQKTVFGGDGLAVHEGKTCFVEGALPGERVLAEIFQTKSNFSRARLVRVLAASQHRIESLCRYASHCGGCQYQHVEYAEELRLKEGQLAEILKIVPGLALEKISPIVPSPSAYGYRNGVTLHAVPSPAKGKGRKPSARLGFIGKDNVSKIPVQSCLIADPRLVPVFGKEFLLRKETESIVFKVSEQGEIVADNPEKFFRIRIGEESFLTSSRGFFQNNLAVSAALAERVKKWVISADPGIFFDLYAGVGVFSILCGRSARKIVCIEESPESVQALGMNAEEKKIPLKIVQGRVEKKFQAVWESDGGEASFVVLDPPRQGLAPELASYLAKNPGISSLAYVSCDPVTLARDLKILLSGGFWQVKEAVPFDMFPRTKHLETAVLLTAV